MLNNIIADLRNLEGREVGSGYFRHIYSNEVDATTISILDVLESLRPYELNSFDIMNYLEEKEESIISVSFEEFLEIEEYEETSANNSYNWNAPISNHFNYRIYESNLYEGIIVEFMVHRFGDVRCNYSEETYLQFKNEYEFYEVLGENNIYFTIEDKENNNIEYDVCIDIFNDCPTIEKILIEESETEYLEGYEAYELLEKLLED
jgi:hypothetical protein